MIKITYLCKNHRKLACSRISKTAWGIVLDLGIKKRCRTSWRGFKEEILLIRVRRESKRCLMLWIRMAVSFLTWLRWRMGWNSLALKTLLMIKSGSLLAHKQEKCLSMKKNLRFCSNKWQQSKPRKLLQR